MYIKTKDGWKNRCTKHQKFDKVNLTFILDH